MNDPICPADLKPCPQDECTDGWCWAIDGECRDGAAPSQGHDCEVAAAVEKHKRELLDATWPYPVHPAIENYWRELHGFEGDDT